MTESDNTEFTTVNVTVSREIPIPIDLLGDDDPDHDELKERAEDWFWNWPHESLQNEPGPSRDDIAVDHVSLPRSLYYDGDDRLCTECGASVEDESYLYWAFHTCSDCASEESEDTA